LVCAGNYWSGQGGRLARACSARHIRWSPWPSCVKPAIETGFEVWIGRSNTACDAGVTRTLLPNDPKGLPAIFCRGTSQRASVKGAFRYSGLPGPQPFLSMRHGCWMISEIEREEVCYGVRNVTRPASVRLRSSPRQRNGENLCRPHPKARAKFSPNHGQASIAIRLEP
jgi:hypothetical protein